MKKMSTDALIAQTMLEFLDERRITQISVQDIAKEVGISTRTFYNYFQDKFDVCNFIYDGIIEECICPGGQRVVLGEFFDRLMRSMSGKYLHFLKNTICYTGQNNIGDYIVKRGVADLDEQLRLTGHADMVTAENDMLLTVYMRGLASTLRLYFNSSKPAQKEMVLFDKAEMLPRSLYDALTAPLEKDKINALPDR